jgi:electron transfer flavoprotein beta subunit
MKILVCISCVPDTTSKITLTDNKIFNYDGLTFVVGPYDDYALSRAIELKESNNAEVVVLHVGNINSESLIRKCLALGADSAIRIDTDPIDSIQVSNEISDFVKKNPFDLILMGKETIDYGNALVPALVASNLGMPVFSPVQKLNVAEDNIEIEVETIEGKASIATHFPVVLGCQEPIAEWKIPNMRGIMSARAKEILIIPAGNYEGDKLVKLELNESKRKGVIIDSNNPEELIDILFNA